MKFNCMIALLLVASVTTIATAQNKKQNKKNEPAPTPPIKALLITGGCCHDYASQMVIIKKGLAARANIECDVVLQGFDGRDVKINAYQSPNWAEGYDVVIHNECFGGVVDVDFIKNITKQHKAGLPAVMIHCSLHSYRNADTDEWRQVVGVSSFNHQHKTPVEVKNLQPKHPVMKGFPESWMTPTAELYNIEKVWPGCTPLGHAYGSKEKKNNVCIWVNEYGKGKTFGTSLGHYNEMMEQPIWMDLVTRGVLWSVGKLNEDGTPAAGYEAKSAK